jgi:hypothetical protein
MRVARWPARTRQGEAYATEPARASLRLILLETVLWANERADPQGPIHSLRSKALAPYLFSASRHETVFDVAWKRHRELNLGGRFGRHEGPFVDAESIGLGEITPILETGRLLVWERDSTIDDGVGEAVTGGYLDESDMPPWDTWIAYVDGAERAPARYLVSWVPGPFVTAVAEAVSANAYAALYWLRDSKLTMEETLRSEGLLV